jgi:hypothetical protein
MINNVSPRALIARLCILGMLIGFVIVVPVVRADVMMNCDYCSNEYQCNAMHFAVDQWYADKYWCSSDCETEKSNRDSQCEANKNGAEQAARDQCTDPQTGELDQNCYNQKDTDIQTQYFNCLDFAEWRHNGCLQECDDRFQDPPEDCSCYYESNAGHCW